MSLFGNPFHEISNAFNSVVGEVGNMVSGWGDTASGAAQVATDPNTYGEAAGGILGQGLSGAWGGLGTMLGSFLGLNSDMPGMKVLWGPVAGALGGAMGAGEAAGIAEGADVTGGAALTGESATGTAGVAGGGSTAGGGGYGIGEAYGGMAAPEASGGAATSGAVGGNTQYAALDTGTQTDAMGDIPNSASPSANPEAAQGTPSVNPEAAADPSLNQPINPEAQTSFGTQSPATSGTPSTANSAAGDPTLGGGANPEAPPGSMNTGSGNSFPTLDQFGNFLKGNAKTLLPLGLTAASLMGQKQQSPNSGQLNTIASNQSTAGSQATALMQPLATDTLPASQQASLDSSNASIKAQIRAKYSKMGLAGSTMEQQELQNVDQQSQVVKGQIEQQLFQAGTSAAGLSNNAASIYQQLAQTTLSQDQQLRNALQRLAGSYAAGSAVSGGGG